MSEWIPDQGPNLPPSDRGREDVIPLECGTEWYPSAVEDDGEWSEQNRKMNALVRGTHG